MNLFKKLKNIFQRNKNLSVKKEETSLVNYDTSQINLPKMKDLPKEEQELVKKYIYEIHIDDLESLMNYSKELNQKFNQNTTFLIEYLYELEEEIEKIKSIKRENLLEKKIELSILESKIYLVNQTLIKIQKETFLRAVALLEVIKKQSSLVLEFLGIFGEAKRIKNKMLKQNLNATLDQMKIVLITMDMQKKSINNTTNHLIKLMETLQVYAFLSKENENQELKVQVLKEKIMKLERIFKILFEKELVDKKRLEELIGHLSSKNAAELMNRLAVLEHEVDIFAFENKEKLHLFYAQLCALEMTYEKRKENLATIEKIECIFDLYKNQVPEEYINYLYRQKFYSLTLHMNEVNFTTFGLDFSNPLRCFKYKNKKEKEIYEEISYEELQTFFNHQPLFMNYLDKRWFTAVIKKLRKAFNDPNFLANNLALLLTVNHPEFYERFFFDLIRDYSFPGMVYFVYDSKVFTDKDEKTVLFHSEVDREIYLKKLAQLIESYFSGDPYSLTTQNSLPLFFLLLYGNSKINPVFKINDEKLTIAAGITGIDLYPFSPGVVMFSHPESISNIHFPKTYQNFGFLSSFGYPKKVEEINIPSSFKIIDRKMFSIFVGETGYTSLKKIKLEEGVEEIDGLAFLDCKVLEEIHLPSSLKIIESDAFKDLQNLKRVYYHPSLLETFGKTYFYELFEANRNVEFIPFEEVKVKVKK